MMQCSFCLTWQSHTVFIRIENRRHSTKALLPENKIIARYEKGWKMQEMWAVEQKVLAYRGAFADRTIFWTSSRV
jgi:hypothetical protein